jgi:LuxR family maltose regulon positive regulatory protein
LDPPDDEPTLFVTALVAAIRTAAAGACATTLGLANTTPPPTTETLASAFVREIAQLGESLVLVLDDYHAIHRREAHDFLTAVLRRPPANLHLVISTRHDPPLPLSRLRARGQLGEVRASELRFTDLEASRFLARVAGEEHVDRGSAYNRRIEGWPTGLRLAAISLRKRLPIEPRSATPGIGYARDYLLQEVLDVLGPEKREALEWTSPLGRLRADLCRWLLGPDGIGCHGDGGEHLADLVRENLFLVPLDDRQEWYRYHHLFQDMLVRELERRHGAGSAARVFRLAGTWFERHGMVEDALRCHVSSGDTPDAARLVRKHGRGLMDQERWARLDRWLRLVPPEVLEDDPELLLLKAWNLENRYLIPEAIALLEKVDTLLAISERSPAELGAIRHQAEALRSALPYLHGDPERSVAMATRALEKLAPDLLSERGYALILLVLARQMSGQRGQAVEDALNALRESGPKLTTFQGRVFTALCFNYWLEADSQNLALTAERALSIGTQAGLPETEQFGRYFMGIGAYVTGDLATAERTLSRGISRFSTRDNTWIHAMFARALVRQAYGDDDGAGSMADEVLSHALEVQNAHQIQTAQAFRAELALRQERPAEALQWVTSAEMRPSVHMLRFYIPEITYVRGLLADPGGSQVDKARAFSDALLERVTHAHNRRVAIDAHLVAALVALRLNQHEGVQTHLSDALKAAQPGGLIRPFLDLGSSLPPLLGAIEVAPDLTAFVAQLDSASGSGPATAFEDGTTHGSPRPEGSPDLRAISVSGAADFLTDRELEVLLMLPDRLSNKEIAKRIFVSPETVKKHLSSVYAKLDVPGRREAVRKAHQLGLL